MYKQEINSIVQKQRDFFATGATLPVKFRTDALKKLRSVLYENEEKIADALKADLGKSSFEGYMCETGLVISEISYMISHTKRFAREKTVLSPIAQFHSRSYIKPTPYGVTLIMSPWNYPFLLSIDPLCDAISAGNTVVLKPSAYSPETSRVIKEILEKIFPPEFVCVITGGREENIYLLDEKFDYIFFTGSKTVGSMVLEKAAPNLTPVTLELGGKSPCIVDETANIPLAAKRIAFGKYLNCGQTCVAPDYILCHESKLDELIKQLKIHIEQQYGSSPLSNENYGKIINKKHFERVCGLIVSEKVVHGGKSDPDLLKIEPTVMSNVTENDPVMQEEIFGPVLPILTYKNTNDVITFVNSREKPLALYIFSSDKNRIRTITSRCPYGGGCINDVVIHLATSNMGFGGVGESGMGSYHGKTGFDTFTHYKSIVDKKNWLDLPMRYQPYKGLYGKMIRLFLK